MQPERHIEKQLRAFARWRRDQAGGSFDLHPATRRLLQDEVARQHGRPHASSSAGRLAWLKFWPRIAFATGTLAILAVGVYVLLPPLRTSPPSLALAQRERVAPDSESVSQSSSPQPEWAVPRAAAPAAVGKSEATDFGKSTFVAGHVASRPVEESTRSQHRFADTTANTSALVRDMARELDATSSPNQVAPEEMPLAAAASSERALTTALPPSDEMPSTATRELIARRPDQNGSAAPASGAGFFPKGKLPPVSDSSSSATLREESKPVFASSSPAASPAMPELLMQQFKRVEADSARRMRQAATESVAVLTSFKLEQREREIRIVDADGSVYTGIAAASNAALTDRTKASSPVALGGADKTRMPLGAFKTEARGAADAVLLQPTLHFSVRGTNATLRQAIVFTGTVQSVSEPSQLGISNQAVGIAGSIDRQSPVQSLLPNARLFGRARLSDGREVDINAVTVSDVSSPAERD